MTPPRELEGFVIVVEVVLELGSEQHGRQHHLVCIEIVQTEVFHCHVVPVDVDDCDHQALCGEAGVLVQSAQEVGEGDGWCSGGVEDGVTGGAFLLDKVGE